MTLADADCHEAHGLVRYFVPRNHVLDALRGLCLVIMTIDHWEGIPFKYSAGPFWLPMGRCWRKDSGLLKARPQGVDGSRLLLSACGCLLFCTNCTRHVSQSDHQEKAISRALLVVTKHGP
jgi:uncharacterized membrane protein